ncbi:hypothetical protein F383_26155 [Gossypium arboreum]|uniref:Uncharacterized protein n=1 Tax=Gossypium arboreum TaxID=29729 RepID=A0A0B0MNV2_GOSAR|nr:hypothetical protein F383_26155 [Gossypium arboreum]
MFFMICYTVYEFIDSMFLQF